MTARKPLSLAALVLLFTVGAFADSKARIVRLSYSEGDVQLDRGDGSGLKHAFLNMPVIEGSKLNTGHDARVEVEFEDGSTMRLVPDSQVEFQELRLRPDGGRASLVAVEAGTVYFNLRQRNEDDFRVAAGKEQIALEKSSRFRVEVSAEALKLAVFKGDLNLIRASGDRLQLRKEETFELDLNDPSRYFLSRGVREAAFDYWDKDRDKERDEYAHAHSLRDYNSAYYYGATDLVRYGSFFNVAGYGPVWRPYGFSLGWDPFFDGSWVWYPSVGYVWVSPYQWGWTPYRYGQWVYVNNYGWCWRQGYVWNTWYAAPPAIHPAVIYTKNVPPAKHTDPIIVVGSGISGGSGGTGGKGIVSAHDDRGIGHRPVRGTHGGAIAGESGLTGSGVSNGTGGDLIRGKRDGRAGEIGTHVTRGSDEIGKLPDAQRHSIDPVRDTRAVTGQNEMGKVPDAHRMEEPVIIPQPARTVTPAQHDNMTRPERERQMPDTRRDSPRFESSPSSVSRSSVQPSAPRISAPPATAPARSTKETPR